MIGSVPDSEDGDSQFGAGPSVPSRDLSQRIFCVDSGHYLICVGERIAQILHQLGLRLGRIGTSIFAFRRGSLALNLVCLAPDFLDTELSVFMQRLQVQEAAG